MFIYSSANVKIKCSQPNLDYVVRRHQTEGSASPYSPRRDSRPARRKDVFEFAEDIMYKKAPRTRKRSRSRSYLRSRSRSKSVLVFDKTFIRI